MMLSRNARIRSSALLAISLLFAACAAPSADSTPVQEVETSNSAFMWGTHQDATRRALSGQIGSIAVDTLYETSLIADKDDSAKIRSRAHFDNCYWQEGVDWGATTCDTTSRRTAWTRDIRSPSQAIGPACGPAEWTVPSSFMAPRSARARRTSSGGKTTFGTTWPRTRPTPAIRRPSRRTGQACNRRAPSRRSGSVTDSAGNRRSRLRAP
jgi:hypothetical protein